MNYPPEISTLPVSSYLDEICSSLKKSSSHFLILTAETAAGKSTVVPLSLLEKFSGNILMLEPRKLAVLNIASRVSDLIGEKLGETCGYQIAFENITSTKTRFTVLTEEILTRKLQNDPFLENVSVVVIDEFHERSIHADLALAFLKESIQLRDDLFVIVMSATIDSEKLSLYLGSRNKKGKFEKAPIISVPGRKFPVEIRYVGNITPTQAVLNELSNSEISGGSILVFLPGIKEIRKTKVELEERKCRAEILVLHSSVSFEEQRRVLREPAASSSRRVILSSAIAETSLTVPDVTVVIDSGLSRLNSFNRNVGMQTLVTRNESVFNAEQRAGRAGRVREGKCIRLWNESDVRTKYVPPEILRTDLSTLVLECAEWGVDSPEKLSWLDEPPEETWKTSEEFLEKLGCLKDKDITDLGKAALSLGIDVRLACVVLNGISYGKENESIKLALKYSNLPSFQQKEFYEHLQYRVKKVKKFLRNKKNNPSEYTNTNALLSGFPDRIAIRENEVSRNQNEIIYQFPSGRKAKLCKKVDISSKYIIAPEVNAGDFLGTIYSWEKIHAEEAESFLIKHAKTYIKTEFVGETKKLQKTEYLSYGKLVLKSKKLQPLQSDYKDAICSEIEQKGIDWLPLNDSTKNLLIRVQFYIQQSTEMGTNKEELLKNKYKNISKTSKEWLFPFLKDDEKNIKSETVYKALFWYLNGEGINKIVPTEFKLPNGKKRKLIYKENNGKIRPVLEIIIQQIFGCMQTPKILGIPILLKLLSPAKRPLQITDDLENFWKLTWPEICKEMKGLYPKHNWNYRVISEE